MTVIAELWRRLPVVVRAVLAGGAAAAAGTLPWVSLVSSNSRYGSALPWAVPIMAVYLVYPVLTVLLWVIMGAVVAGVVEETSLRGYLQRPIERRHGPVVAILISGSVFGLAHFTHPEIGLVLLPYYLAVSAVYGALAYLTDSIFPSMVLHAGGNMFSAFDLFARGRSEWQLLTTPRPLIWQTGADAAFWGNVVALVVVGTLTVFAYAALAGVTRRARAAGSA